jgi:acetyl esterase/lipase
MLIRSDGTRRRERWTLPANYRRLVAGATATMLLTGSAAAAGLGTRASPVEIGGFTPAATAGATRLPAPPGVYAQKVGEDTQGVYIFTLERLTGSVPVVLFLHGGCGTDPYHYAGWIDHIVRNGSVVIFPTFAKSGCDSSTPDATIENNIVNATKTAVSVLQQQGQVQPDANRFAIIGHSYGGGLSAQIAAMAQQVGLPVPRLVIPVMPGWRNSKNYPIQNVQNIAPSTFLMVIEGDKDQFEGTRYGWSIFQRATQIPLRQRAFIRLRSKQHDGRTFLADHYAPLSPMDQYRYEVHRNRPLMNLLMSMADVRQGETDDLDYNGFWRLYDNMAVSAFRPGCDVNCALQHAGGPGAVDWTVDTDAP